MADIQIGSPHGVIVLNWLSPTTLQVEIWEGENTAKFRCVSTIILTGASLDNFTAYVATPPV